MESEKKLTVPDGAVFTIAANITLTNDGTTHIQRGGMLINNGKIINNGGIIDENASADNGIIVKKVNYIDENGESAESLECRFISENLTNLSYGYYVASGDVTINGNLSAPVAEINLIIEDGAKLTVNGAFFGKKITVFGQQNATGELKLCSDSITNLIYIEYLSQ